jgi:DNA polymerase (family X)
VYSIAQGPKLVVHHCTPNQAMQVLFLSSGAAEFNDAFVAAFGASALQGPPAPTDAVLFQQVGIAYAPPYLRHGAEALRLAQAHLVPKVLETNQVQGIIHSHSRWSDGIDTIKNMALAAKGRGFSYLVMSDHSRSAGYANGLSIERVAAQHAEIDALNLELAPFKVFKSIESDILIDGSLDYPPDILHTFDLVIASVHSVLKMPEEKAMLRLMNAIKNPFTSILGHPTGRLLLSRAGYPIHHKTIIDTCVAHNVVIELNAHPRRLDIDWRWLPYALEAGATISINPDAHAISGFDDIKYGVLAAQKGGLEAKNNLSSYTPEAFSAFVALQKLKRPSLG